MKKFFKTNATKFYRQLTKVIRVLLIAIAVVFLLVTIKLYFVNHSAVENPQFTDGNLKIVMIDVENGDCFLVLQNNKALLVDSGYVITYSKVNEALKENNVQKLDYMILTHPHRDHAGGIFGLFLNYRVDTLYLSDDVKELDMSVPDRLFYIPMAAMIKYNDMFANNVKQAEDFMFSDSSVEFLGPVGGDYKKVNNYSLVFKLTYGEKSILFTGDMERINERELLKSNIDVSADIMKIAHHGSYTSSSNKFIDAVNPNYAIISCGNGKHNNYGHPVKRIVRYLEKKQIPLYRTDELGTVEIELTQTSVRMFQAPGDYRSGEELIEGNGLNQKI